MSNGDSRDGIASYGLYTRLARWNISLFMEGE